MQLEGCSYHQLCRSSGTWSASSGADALGYPLTQSIHLTRQQIHILLVQVARLLPLLAASLIFCWKEAHQVRGWGKDSQVVEKGYFMSAPLSIVCAFSRVNLCLQLLRVFRFFALGLVGAQYSISKRVHRVHACPGH